MFSENFFFVIPGFIILAIIIIFSLAITSMVKSSRESRSFRNRVSDIVNKALDEMEDNLDQGYPGVFNDAIDRTRKMQEEQSRRNGDYDQGSWVCSGCGATNRLDEKYCPYCGTKRW